MTTNDNKCFFGKLYHQERITLTEDFLTVLRQGKPVARLDSSAVVANLKGLEYEG